MAATAITILSSAPRTVSGEGSSVDVTNLGATLRLTLDITATECSRKTIAVAIQTSHDGAAWREVGRFNLKTLDNSVANERKTFPGCDKYVRAVWSISSVVPVSVTISVAGEVI